MAIARLCLTLVLAEPDPSLRAAFTAWTWTCLVTCLMLCTPGWIWCALLALLRLCGTGLGQWGSAPSAVLLCLAPALYGAASSRCSIACLFYLQNKPNISIKIHCMSKLSETLFFLMLQNSMIDSLIQFIKYYFLWIQQTSIFSFGLPSWILPFWVSPGVCSHFNMQSYEFFPLIITSTCDWNLSKAENSCFLFY